MQPVRVLLVILAVVAVGLAGWALGARDAYDAPAAADPAVTAPALTTPAPAPRDQATPDPATPDPATRPDPAPPRISGFGSEPVLPTEGAFWKLPAQAGLLTLVTGAEHASRVEFWLTPTGTGVSHLSRKLGQDSNGRDGWLVNWHYKNEPLLGHLTVKAIGPGGTDQETVGIYHPDPADQP